MPDAVLLIVSMSLFPGQAPGARPLAPELARHQGTWRVVSFVHDGTEAEAEVMASIRRTVDGERIVWSRDGKSFSATGMKLDPGAMPAAIDLIPEGGPHRDRPVLGIYRFAGESLVLCVAAPDAPRPESFDAPSGSRRTLMRLEREPTDRRH